MNSTSVDPSRSAGAIAPGPRVPKSGVMTPAQKSLRSRPGSARVPASDHRFSAPKGGALLHLGIDGLPLELSGLVPGMLYVLMTDTQSMRVALATQSLSASADVSSPSVLVTGHDPYVLVKKAKNFAPALESQLAAGSARILRFESDIGRRLLRFGSAKLIEDLKAQSIAPNSLVIVDQANKILGLSDPSTASVTSQLFQSWAEAARLTLLFFVDSDKENPREYASLKTIAEHWAGLGVVKSSASKANITFKHWFGTRGLTPGARFSLGLSNTGQLGVSVAQDSGGSGESTTITPSRDDQLLLATSKSLEGLGDFGSRMRSCDDPLDLMDFARRARGGTVLLHYSHREEFERLAKLVANLRSIASAEVRIVVRECGVMLRKAENYALLQLGASFVLPKGLSADSARALIEQLGSATLRRIHDPRGAEQLRELLADSSGRLLTPYDFRLRVLSLLDLSSVGLPHTLVIFQIPVTGLATRVAKLICPHVRDVMFTDVEGRLLLFLFGCNAQSADMVMSRLFASKIASAKAWHCSADPEHIRLHLSRIAAHPSKVPSQAGSAS
jgi:hypothetical protein